jgi:hypothetical protein
MTQQVNSTIPMGLCLENYDYAYPHVEVFDKFMATILAFL